MNPWNEFMVSVIIFLAFGVVLLYSIIQLIRKKDKKKLYCISTAASLIILVGFGLFSASHKTSFRYNDWAIVNSNINYVRNKYGEFDIGEIKEGEKGRVGYYLYTDNGPVMPDHLKHYYYIRYDEWGVVYEVYDSCQPGG